MPISHRGRRYILPFAALLLLAACQSAEERAEAHYQNALGFLAEDDFERARIEFQNVFEDDPRRLDARLAFGRMLLDVGRPGDAYGQFVAAAEQHPDDLEARTELAILAMTLGNWEDARRHGDRAVELAPDRPDVRMIEAALAYEAAASEQDHGARQEAAARLADLRAELDDARIADQLVIDNHLRDGQFGSALREIDAALEKAPSAERLHQLKLQVLGRLSDEDGIREQLETMVALFPENQAYATTLIQWHVTQGDLDAAEAFIRGRIAEGAEGEEQRAFLISFLAQTRGAEAAIAEAQAAIDAGVNPDLFRSLQAGLLFDEGERDRAVGLMETILDGAEPSGQSNRIRVALARMHIAMGNDVAARRLVEEVLASDSSQVDAIKIRAGWMIEADAADDAIVLLRTALDQAPNDPEIMTIMAEAHLRNGSRSLAGEMLSLAVEASGSAPRESLGYASFLFEDAEYPAAEAVLVGSLRVAPGNTDVLALLGRVYAAQEDWPRLEQVEATLRRMGDEASLRAADATRILLLSGQQRQDEVLEFLEGAVEGSDSTDAATVALVRARLEAGQIEEAERLVDSLVAARPDDSWW